MQIRRSSKINEGSQNRWKGQVCNDHHRHNPFRCDIPRPIQVEGSGLLCAQRDRMLPHLQRRILSTPQRLPGNRSQLGYRAHCECALQHIAGLSREGGERDDQASGGTVHRHQWIFYHLIGRYEQHQSIYEEEKKWQDAVPAHSIWILNLVWFHQKQIRLDHLIRELGKTCINST